MISTYIHGHWEEFLRGLSWGNQQMGMNSSNPLNKGDMGNSLKRWMCDFLEGEIWGTCGLRVWTFFLMKGGILWTYTCLKIECQQPNLKFNDVLWEVPERYDLNATSESKNDQVSWKTSGFVGTYLRNMIMYWNGVFLDFLELWLST
jgi:hypothetical protein